MGNARWHFQNYITQTTQVTPSSAKAGMTAYVVKDGEGSARMEAYGDFVGDIDTKFTAEVYTTAAGAEIGSALFRWKKDTTVSGWEGTGIATQTTYYTLENGIQIRWVAGSGDDFTAGDSWSFFAMRPRGKGALFIDDPNTQLRSDDVLILSIAVDLGTTQQITSAILGHHNFTSAATIVLQGNGTTSWGAPSYEQTITWTTQHASLFLDESYRYWRWVIQDQSNSNDYLALSKAYLGLYFEPTYNFSSSYNRTTQAAGFERVVGGMPVGRWVTGYNEMVSVPYEIMTTTDFNSVQSMFQFVHDRANNKGRPVWFTPDSSEPGDVLYGLPSMTLSRQFYNSLGKQHTVAIEFAELARTLF
uniref:Uncharacterized protein n=1 Tax=viral metagenome TaxID=1070528 RepID=A0A6H1ZUR4_9ZZZZ